MSTGFLVSGLKPTVYMRFRGKSMLQAQTRDKDRSQGDCSSSFGSPVHKITSSSARPVLTSSSLFDGKRKWLLRHQASGYNLQAQRTTGSSGNRFLSSSLIYAYE